MGLEVDAGINTIEIGNRYAAARECQQRDCIASRLANRKG
jgi:hypothetical protein